MYRRGSRSGYGFRHTWTPSKEAAREFAQKMDEIAEYCRENGISQSFNGDSYYFTLNGKQYRVSNHTVKASNSAAFDWNTMEQKRRVYHPNGEEGLVCITAGKTRIREIYEALKAGKELDRRGNVKTI